VSPAIPPPGINTLIIRLAVPPVGQWFMRSDLKLVDQAARSISLTKRPGHPPARASVFRLTIAGLARDPGSR
jgi:hypothetical protein